MKYIKKITEDYERTVGFRYSEPKEKFKVTSKFVGDLNQQSVSEVLDHWRVKHSDIEITHNPETLETEEGDIEVDGTVELNIFIYNDKEIESIIRNLGKSLYLEYDIQLIDINAVEAPNIRKF